MSPASFTAAVDVQIAGFESNALLQRVVRGDIALADYQRLLGLLFHQVRSSSNTFALAAIHMPWPQWQAREYLFRHAHEEAAHWRWILNDLEATDYRGPAVDAVAPAPAVQSYIDLNTETAVRFPIGRLAIAAVLEGIGGRLSERYAAQAARRLGLGERQTQFLAGHAGTDAIHSREITEMLALSVSSSEDWGRLIAVAEQAGALYRGIYELAAERPQ